MKGRAKWVLRREERTRKKGMKNWAEGDLGLFLSMCAKASEEALAEVMSKLKKLETGDFA